MTSERKDLADLLKQIERKNQQENIKKHLNKLERYSEQLLNDLEELLDPSSHRYVEQQLKVRLQVVRQTIKDTENLLE
jgi:hypothetical protein